MRVVFCGGGTGGHVYPALTVAVALRRLISQPDLLYIGVRGKLDAELVAQEGIPFAAVTAGPLRVGSPMVAALGGLRLLRGIAESYRLLARFRPDVVFATGGYGSVGVGLAARLLRLPLLVFLPDVRPGLAVRLLAKAATRLAVSNEAALATMPRDRTELTGYPVRPAFFAARREEARARLSVEPGLPLLLVSGGSTGANALNQAAASLAPALLERASLLHISGYGDEAWLRAARDKLPAHLRSRYHLHAYLHQDMPLALAAADLAVMRAGASTLGELPAAALPAVLVPGAFSDQVDNARYLEERGAAVVLPQTRLAELPDVIDSLLIDPERLAAMRTAMASLARPDAAERLARLILQLAGAREAVTA